MWLVHDPFAIQPVLQCHGFCMEDDDISGERYEPKSRLSKGHPSKEERMVCCSPIVTYLPQLQHLILRMNMNVYILLHAEVESKSHLKSFHRVLVLMTKRGLSQGPLPDPLPCSEACQSELQRAVLSLRWKDGVDMDQDSRVPSDWIWWLSVGVVNLSPSTIFLLELYSVPRLCDHCSEGKPGENTFV